MSYILDALRRADAERERGNVPGLHSQPVAAASAAPPPRATPPWAVVGAGTALLVLGAAAWWAWGRDPKPAAAPTPLTTTASAPVAAPAPVAAVAAPPAIARPFPAPVAAVPSRATAAPTMPVPAPMPAPVTAPAPPAAATNPPTRIVAYDLLPEDVRRQMPALAIGGAIYSDNAASRMLIVGGQLLHEGENAAPGVVLEQIKPNSAVLRWRDLRYELSF